MAQTQERTPATKSPPKTSSTSSTSSSATPKPSFLARLRNPLTTTPSSNGTSNGQTPRAGRSVFKSFFGILIWFVASQVIMYLLILLDSALTKPGGQPPLQTSHLFPPNTPVLGGVTPFLLLYAIVVIGLWFLLIRFNLIPRDMFNARAQAEQRAQQQVQRRTGTTATTGASTGPKKTRAQRRYAETQAQAQVAAKAKGGKNGVTAKPLPKAPAKISEAARATDVYSGENDQEYERVRSAERLRRRREAKR